MLLLLSLHSHNFSPLKAIIISVISNWSTWCFRVYPYLSCVLKSTSLSSP